MRPQSLSLGILVAVFFYFGWDVSSNLADNLAEETADAKTTSGLGGIFGVSAIFGLFLLAQVAIQMTLTPDEIHANSANLLPMLGRVALPGSCGAVAILTVLISAIATIETQFLQCTRLLFSMARGGVIGEALGRLHPRLQTPGLQVSPSSASRFSYWPALPLWLLSTNC
jgi:amino acid transporter